MHAVIQRHMPQATYQLVYDRLVVQCFYLFLYILFIYKIRPEVGRHTIELEVPC